MFISPYGCIVCESAFHAQNRPILAVECRDCASKYTVCMHHSKNHLFIYLLNPVNERKSDYGMMKIEENYSHFQQNAVH